MNIQQTANGCSYAGEGHSVHGNMKKKEKKRYHNIDPKSSDTHTVHVPRLPSKSHHFIALEQPITSSLLHQNTHVREEEEEEVMGAACEMALRFPANAEVSRSQGGRSS